MNKLYIRSPCNELIKKYEHNKVLLYSKGILERIYIYISSNNQRAYNIQPSIIVTL